MPDIVWEQTKKQELAWEHLTNQTTTDLLFGGGAGGGKTLLGCAWLVVMCGMYPGTRWLMGRAKLKALKETTLQTLFDLFKRWDIKPEVDFHYNSIEGTITFANGSVILLRDLFLYPSDPNFDGLGSLEITGAFIDEANQCSFKAWEVVKSRIRYKLDEYGLVPKCMGSCNPSKGWPYTEFYKPYTEGRLAKSSAFIQALAIDNPHISRHYIENLKKIKDKSTKERLLNGNWDYDDDPSCLFQFDAIADLFTNKSPIREGRFISGDLSRKGRDKTPIYLWEGLQVIEITSLPYETKSNVVRTAEWIIAYAEKNGVPRRNIVLDEDGVGGGVVDHIPGCVGFVNGSSPIQPPKEMMAMEQATKVNFANLKTQCYFKLAQRVEHGEIGIEYCEVDVKEAIMEELAEIKQKNIDKDGRIELIDKAVMKQNLGRSPDYADALMMRMIFDIQIKIKPQLFFV